MISVRRPCRGYNDFSQKFATQWRETFPTPEVYIFLISMTRRVEVYIFLISMTRRVSIFLISMTRRVDLAMSFCLSVRMNAEFLTRITSRVDLAMSSVCLYGLTMRSPSPSVSTQTSLSVLSVGWTLQFRKQYEYSWSGSLPESI